MWVLNKQIRRVISYVRRAKGYVAHIYEGSPLPFQGTLDRVRIWILIQERKTA